MKLTSLERKLARCAREIEAAKPKGMSFSEFEKGDHGAQTSNDRGFFAGELMSLLKTDCNMLEAESKPEESPNTLGDGWIAHNPGDPMPVEPHMRVMVRLSSGFTTPVYVAGDLYWGRTGSGTREISAYKAVS